MQYQSEFWSFFTLFFYSMLNTFFFHLPGIVIGSWDTSVKKQIRKFLQSWNLLYLSWIRKAVILDRVNKKTIQPVSRQSVLGDDCTRTGGAGGGWEFWRGGKICSSDQDLQENGSTWEKSISGRGCGLEKLPNGCWGNGWGSEWVEGGTPEKRRKGRLGPDGMGPCRPMWGLPLFLWGKQGDVGRCCSREWRGLTAILNKSLW